MLLPGGIAYPDSGRAPTYSWAPITGAVEASICDARSGARSAPELIAEVLNTALATLGELPATRGDIDGLSVVDQRSLMIELATGFGLAVQWLTHTCDDCGELFDLPIDLAALPVSPATDTFPEADATTTLGRFRFRVPAGGDQIAIAQEDDNRRAIRALVVRCKTKEEGRLDENWADRLTDRDIEAISGALEAVSPSLPWAAEARCPECDHGHVVPIDVTGWVFSLNDPIEDVHEIAAAYGWSERDVLSLTRARRRRYLSLIRRGDPMDTDAT